MLQTLNEPLFDCSGPHGRFATTNHVPAPSRMLRSVVVAVVVDASFVDGPPFVETKTSYDVAPAVVGKVRTGALVVHPIDVCAVDESFAGFASVDVVETVAVFVIVAGPPGETL